MKSGMPTKILGPWVSPPIENAAVW